MAAGSTAEFGPAGAELWDALIEDVEFRPDEIVMVTEMCRLADDLQMLRAELAGAPLMVSGSMGQPTVNPLRVELHRVSGRFESMLKTLGIPDDEGQDASWAGRRLARARHG